MRALLVLFTVTAVPACERARHPADLVELELTGVDAMPPVRITVPRYGARWSAMQGLYYVRGGSLGEGFMTTITVSAKASCFSPRCDGAPITEGVDRRVQRCPGDRGVAVYVEYRAPPLCCTASWVADGALSDERQHIARDIERACERIRR